MTIVDWLFASIPNYWLVISLIIGMLVGFFAGNSRGYWKGRFAERIVCQKSMKEVGTIIHNAVLERNIREGIEALEK